MSALGRHAGARNERDHERGLGNLARGILIAIGAVIWGVLQLIMPYVSALGTYVNSAISGVMGAKN